MSAPVRFVVVYRWQLKHGKEEQFVRAWETVTRDFLEHGGSLGSRLHRAPDGTWLAYAQWPSREAWSAAQLRTAEGEAALAKMTDAIAVRLDPWPLEPVADLLVHAVVESAGHSPGPSA